LYFGETPSRVALSSVAADPRRLVGGGLRANHDHREHTHRIAVNPSVPAKNLRELAALAQSKPGQLNFGSSGTGAFPHLSGELFKTLAGVNLTHVPYKGLRRKMSSCDLRNTTQRNVISAGQKGLPAQ
jgi:tripartite-type tricarboxylate transporter receptor subunit TctC